MAVFRRKNAIDELFAAWAKTGHTTSSAQSLRLLLLLVLGEIVLDDVASVAVAPSSHHRSTVDTVDAFNTAATDAGLRAVASLLKHSRPAVAVVH